MSHTPAPLDEQQAQLVERLRAAGGAPVSFAELRAIGIENPALLCYELAAVGLPVTRTCSPGEGMPALSVRLEPEREPQESGPEVSCPPGATDAEVAPRPRLPPRPDEAPAPRARAALTIAPARPGLLREPLEGPASRIRGGLISAAAKLRLLGQPLESAAAHSLRRLASAAPALERRARRAGQAVRHARPPALISIAALALTLVAVVAIVLGNQAGNEATRVRTEDARGHPDHTAISGRSGRSGQAGPATARAAPASGVSAGLAPVGTQARISLAHAEALEAQGHQLLAEGSYASAIDHLSAAIGASGQSLPSCTQPASEACLTFAYALYDLGRALRLEGHHAEAVAILSERLRIDNQRPTVQRELELARGAPA
jgi:tetratricopeptide (TPR) repeat protein